MSKLRASLPSHKERYLQFRTLLRARQRGFRPIDIREVVLGLRDKPVSICYVEKTLAKGSAANQRTLFPAAKSIDDPDWTASDVFLITGTVFEDPVHSHIATTKMLGEGLPIERSILFELGFLATTHSWSHAFKQGDPAMACLGFVYDDLAHYFMADYPNRLIHKLNSSEEPSQADLHYARGLIDRIVDRKITKYNAQPFACPAMTEGYARRVLVCDQTYADASTVYGKLTDADFEQMLLAAITENPDAEILVKSHPDTSWEPDKRKGYFSHLQSTGRVRILREPVNPFVLFDKVDTVYVGSSQMGLEALFAGKKIVCFGAPFYAGWGLTNDRQLIPHRHRTRTLEEIFYYFYVWYTIYHVPGCTVPSTVNDVLDYIEANRPVSPPPTQAELEAPPKVSVILPVYNVEPYIEQSLRSVMGQTLRDIEIIPVNDQSPDRSQEIIDRLAEEDQRIRPIILKENVRQGFARNAAMEVARGEYVWFLDSDDYFHDPKVLETVYKTAERTGADMVRTRKALERVEDPKGDHMQDREDPSERLFGGAETATNLIQNDKLLQNRHFWNWLYRRDFLEKHRIRFVNSQWEERPFLLKALLEARSITLSTCNSVDYRVRAQSTARRKKSDGDVDLLIKNFFEVVQLLDDKDAFDRASPLRGHADFLLSQYLQYIFIGFPYRVLSSTSSSRQLGWLVDLVAEVFERTDFDVSDFDDRPIALSRKHLSAGAFQLLIAAIRSRNADLVSRAVELKPFPQKDLFSRYLDAPKPPREEVLTGAINRYARNERVEAPSFVGGGRTERPRLVLHVGATKTGSTYIQHLMEINRPALLRSGVWYPEVGLFWQEPRPHKQAGHALFTLAAVRSDPKLREYLQVGVRALEGRVHTIVLSSEAFFLQEESNQIVRYLSEFPCEVIVYIRRQDEWANSQYCEFVGGGAVNRVSEPIDSWLETEETQSRMDYLTTLRRFETVVPRENIKIRVFDKSEMPNGDVLADFAEAAGLPVLNNLTRPGHQFANDACLSGAHIQLLRHYNGLHFNTRDDYLCFIEDVSSKIIAWRKERGIPLPRPMLLTGARRKAILDRLRLSNEEIAREWLGREDGRLFDEKIADATDSQDVVHSNEIEIVQAAFDRWSRKDPVLINPRSEQKSLSRKKTDSRPAFSEMYRVVNYGIFGWRLWGLTPFVRSQVRKRGNAKDLEEFDRDPSGYMHSLQSADYQRIAKRLYPERSVLGPYEILRLWVPLLAWFALKLGGQKYANGIRNNPVLFFRLLRNPAYRAVGRIIFPVGEAVREKKSQVHLSV